MLFGVPAGGLPAKASSHSATVILIVNLIWFAPLAPPLFPPTIKVMAVPAPLTSEPWMQDVLE